MNLKFSPLLIITIFAATCSSKTKVKFIIINNSGGKIDSLIIFPNDNVFSEIKIGDSIIYYSNMTNVPKVDGLYNLSFKKNKKLNNYNFGYYTNGYPLEEYYRIEINPDIIIVKGKYGKGY